MQHIYLTKDAYKKIAYISTDCGICVQWNTTQQLNRLLTYATTWNEKYSMLSESRLTQEYTLFNSRIMKF